MTTTRKVVPGLGVLAVLGLVMSLLVAPNLAGAADHLDAPGLTPPGGELELDIADLYTFEGADPSNTVLAVTFNPLADAGTRISELPASAIQIHIDNDGDARADITYSAQFLGFRPFGEAEYTFIRKGTGRNAESVAPKGRSVGFNQLEREIQLRGRDGGKAYVGLRSDPFFFDLTGFLGTVEGQAGNPALGEGGDFFTDLNTMALVIEVPDSVLGEEIAVWATSVVRNPDRSWSQVDRVGRPAINTVVNSTGPIVQAPAGQKNIFNAGIPSTDVSAFTQATVDALVALSQFDTEGSYSVAEAEALAGVLLPDVLRYDTRTSAAGPLNGRQLADDVIDIELRIVTGGDPLGLFPGRDADGAFNTDNVPPHTNYLSVFPYLGAPTS